MLIFIILLPAALLVYWLNRKRRGGKLLPERGMFDFAKGRRAEGLINLLREQGLG